MAAPVFSVKRKAVPPLVDSDYLSPPSPSKRQQAAHHTISLPIYQLVPPTPSPKKRNPLSSLKKMLSLTRLNTTFSCPKDTTFPSRSTTHPPSTSALWLPLSPLSPPSTDQSAFSRPPSALSLSSHHRSTSCTSVSPSSHHCSASSDNDAPTRRLNPEIELPSPASQKSALTSWYDSWFETQSLLEVQRQQELFSGQPEPRSFFEDDSDDELEGEEDYTTSDSASEYSYSSILPDCSQSDSDSDLDDDSDEEDVTLTVGTRVICRRTSCRVFSASSSEDSHTSTRSSTPRITRRAFELDREQ